ncbi:MAG: hypothetical protein EOM59_19360 [Clostridia bacterium]|nr:hypothetical protein [Clostridia bacterium]
MNLHNKSISFRASIAGQEISSGNIDIIISDTSPPRTWIKSIHIVNVISTFQLFDHEVHAIISAVILNKPELIIRDDITVTLH